MSDDRSTPGDWALELTVPLMTIAVGIGFGRLFEGWSFLIILLTPALATHLSSLMMRHLTRLGGLSVVVPAVVSLCVWGQFAAPGTGWGPFPTVETLREFGDSARTSFESFNSLVAPVPAQLGFVGAASIAMIVCALYADTATFRGRVPIQAMTCHVGVYLFAAIFARGDRQVLAAAVCTAAFALHLLAVRAQSLGHARWRSGDRIRGTWSALSSGGGVLIGALIVVAVLGAAVPWPDRARVDLRKLAGDNSRQVVSPFVSVGNRLTEQSNDVMFTVETEGGPRYWRLTTLDTFENGTWTSNYAFDKSDTLAVNDRSAVTGRGIRQRVRIAKLGGLWMPVAPEARAVEANFDTAYHPESGALITSESAGLRDGATYDVVSVVPTDSFSTNTDGPDDTQANTKIDTDASIERLAFEITGPADTPIDKMRLLQNYFRGFRYSLDVDYSGDSDPMVAFLKSQIGYCQQFSSTFAVMARIVGIPSRVAVGFTYGNQVAPGRWVVRGRHAHAWPEVYLEGIGWAPFEPTPGRGDPSTSSFTGVDGAQDNTEPVVASTTSTTPPSTVVAAPSSTTPTTARPSQEDVIDDEPRNGDFPFVPIAAVLGVLLLAVGALWWRMTAVQRARQPRSDSPSDRIDAAWANVLSDLRRRGFRPEPAETVNAFVVRIGEDWDGLNLDRLGRVVETRLYADEQLEQSDAALAETAASAVAERTVAELTLPGRVRRTLGIG